MVDQDQELAKPKRKPRVKKEPEFTAEIEAPKVAKPRKPKVELTVKEQAIKLYRKAIPDTAPDECVAYRAKRKKVVMVHDRSGGPTMKWSYEGKKLVPITAQAS